MYPRHDFVLVRAQDLICQAWVGVATIGPSTADGGDGGGVGRVIYFRIIHTNVPTNVCIRLAGAAANNFGAIRIHEMPHQHNGGTVVQSFYTADQMSLDEGLVAQQCNGTGGRASMTFVSN